LKLSSVSAFFGAGFPAASIAARIAGLRVSRLA
jgi:hypothetical protein